jgi:hypothetical protein
MMRISFASSRASVSRKTGGDMGGHDVRNPSRKSPPSQPKAPAPGPSRKSPPSQPKAPAPGPSPPTRPTALGASLVGARPKMCAVASSDRESQPGEKRSYLPDDGKSEPQGKRLSLSRGKRLCLSDDDESPEWFPKRPAPVPSGRHPTLGPPFPSRRPQLDTPP